MCVCLFVCCYRITKKTLFKILSLEAVTKKITKTNQTIIKMEGDVRIVDDDH